MSHPALSAATALCLAFTVACSGDGGPGGVGTTEAIPSPAGPASGEPFVAPDGDGVLMSWLERNGEGHDFRFARYDGVAWTEPVTIAHRSDFFVNWADFPSVRVGADGTLWAHWLERGAQGGYDYGVRIVHSTDAGRSWSDAWTPHEDGTPTEHGFVSAFPDVDGTMGFVWLDGRATAAAAGAAGHGAAHRGAMTLRYRDVSVAGEGAGFAPGAETLLDPSVCDCCQTSAALTEQGPVVVYRNRTEDEIRDIYVMRRVDGAWTEGAPVHDDGWLIGGCPVNGPAVAADGSAVAVAWFTAAEDVARAKVAFSSDAGANFGPPTVVDDGNPAGRVDVLLLDDGAALVVWLERTGGDAAEVRMRVVAPDGTMGGSRAVSATTSTRPSGFPRVAPLGDGRFLVAWTDARETETRVRTATLALDR